MFIYSVKSHICSALIAAAFALLPSASMAMRQDKSKLENK